ncbi:MAG: hypothetical protein ACJA2S_003822 [Cyclobacteriaceae bacterium]|jgi:hypothetical protein
MKISILFSVIAFSFIFNLYAQDDKEMNTTNLPYYEIPEPPAKFTAETTAARMIDGLGFRYYWATEVLTEEDLNYRPSDMARSSGETINHILGLTNMILNATKKVANGGPKNKRELTFTDKRKITLENLKEASDILKSSGTDGLEDYKIIFQRGDSTTEMPFWNVINGPISDALWHVGQIVSFRRASGNPFNSKVSVLSGKVKE